VDELVPPSPWVEDDGRGRHGGTARAAPPHLLDGAALRGLRLFVRACASPRNADGSPTPAAVLPHGAVRGSGVVVVVDAVAPWHNLVGQLPRSTLRALPGALTRGRDAMRAALAAAARGDTPLACRALRGMLRGVLARAAERGGARLSSAGACALCADAAPLNFAATFALLVVPRHHVTPAALAAHILRLLAVNGALAVGYVGKSLRDGLVGGTLPSTLKERFGGMKTFLEAVPGVFRLASDHEFNPTVMVAPELLAAVGVRLPARL
jgi:hypothetical protein